MRTFECTDGCPGQPTRRQFDEDNRTPYWMANQSRKGKGVIFWVMERVGGLRCKRLQNCDCSTTGGSNFKAIQQARIASESEHRCMGFKGDNSASDTHEFALEKALETAKRPQMPRTHISH